MSDKKEKLDAGLEIDGLVDKFKSRSLDKSSIAPLSKVLVNCSSCPILNYTNPIESDYPLCGNCFMYRSGLLMSLEAEGGKSHNEGLGYLLSSLSSGTPENKQKPNKPCKAERLKRYKELWLDEAIKPSKEWLSRELGISRRQVYRDLVSLGYISPKGDKEVGKE